MKYTIYGLDCCYIDYFRNVYYRGSFLCTLQIQINIKAARRLGDVPKGSDSSHCALHIRDTGPQCALCSTNHITMQINRTLLNGVYFMYWIMWCPTCNALKVVLTGRRVSTTVCKLILQNYFLHLIQVWCEMYKLKLSDEYKFCLV
jgi:hypothetical protein